MRLIRGARIITNFRGSFPAVGDRPCRQILFGNYNRGLYCLPMPIHSAFSFSGPDFRQFDRDLRCTPAGDEDVRPAAGIKNVRFLPDMPEIHRSICQGSLLLDDPIRRISVSGLRSRAVLQLSINGRGPPHTFPHKDNCNFSPFGICSDSEPLQFHRLVGILQVPTPNMSGKSKSLQFKTHESWKWSR